MSKNNIKTSVVIPTKNRPFDLIKALESIFRQSVIPEELIIVDQSKTPHSKILALSIFKKFQYVNFQYIYDKSISGLIEAKKIGVYTSNGDLIFFLEDDVILDSDYIEEIILGFSKNIEMIGCSGIIKNHPPKNNMQLNLFNIFHIGIFSDKRFDIFAQARISRHRQSLVKSDKLSGGVSAWKREVFLHVAFDLSNDFHMLEDIDFSTRVAMKFGPLLYINPNAKLDHFFAPSGRGSLLAQRRRKTRECIVYYKKRSKCNNALLSVTILMIGIFFESIFISLLLKSFSPLNGFLLGLRDGILHKISLDPSS